MATIISQVKKEDLEGMANVLWEMSNLKNRTRIAGLSHVGNLERYHEKRSMFVIGIRDEVLGYIEIEKQITKEGNLEIKRIYVEPRARGNHLGSLLVSHVETIAKEMGATAAVYRCHNSNKRALNFFARLGYETESKIFGYHALQKQVRI